LVEAVVSVPACLGALQCVLYQGWASNALLSDGLLGEGGRRGNASSLAGGGYDFWVLRDPWHSEFCVLQINFPDLLAQRPPWPDLGTAESGSSYIKGRAAPGLAARGLAPLRAAPTWFGSLPYPCGNLRIAEWSAR
jgi:hypothetical protein